MASKDKPPTTSELVAQVAESTKLSKKDVQSVFEALEAVIAHQVRKKSSVKLFGIKVAVKQKAATKAREGRNPSTGESMMIKAKPARNVVKATVLKKLKDLV